MKRATDRAGRHYGIRQENTRVGCIDAIKQLKGDFTVCMNRHMKSLDRLQDVCMVMRNERAELEFNSRKLLRKLESDGWEVKRISGSHHSLKKAGVPYPIVLVHPKKDLPIGLVRRIYKDAGWLS